MNDPFCQTRPPTYWARLKSMGWRIISAIIAFVITAWLGLQPWFWELIGLGVIAAS